MSEQTKDSADASRVALITGASRGLGFALAQALAQQGWTLIVDARGAEALKAARQRLEQEHPEAHIHAYAGDVADRRTGRSWRWPRNRWVALTFWSITPASWVPAHSLRCSTTHSTSCDRWLR